MGADETSTKMGSEGFVVLSKDPAQEEVKADANKNIALLSGQGPISFIQVCRRVG